MNFIRVSVDSLDWRRLTRGHGLLAALGLAAMTGGCGAADPARDEGATASRTHALMSYAQEVKLTVATGVANDFLGAGAALSADGSTAILGATGQADGASLQVGAAHVFVRSATVWSPVQMLQAMDRAANENFGSAVAMSADGATALVAGENEDDGGKTNNGAVYVFIKSSGMWMQQAKLVAGDKDTGDHFGRSVALSNDGNIALIGAADQDEGATTNNGAAYVFARSMGTWTEVKKLLASDIAGAENFGQSVSLSGDGKLALIGANNEDDAGLSDNGAAYVFVDNAGTWMQQAKLFASDKAAASNFGSSVALTPDGSAALIGAQGHDGGGLTDSGAGYIFRRMGSTWTQQAMLRSGDPAMGDLFGSSAGLSSDGEIAALGARGKAPNTIGAGYVFVLLGNSYVQQAKLLASDPISADHLGITLGLSADGYRVLLASPDVNVSTVANAGAGYIFNYDAKANGQACQFGRECQSRFCADGVCCDANCGSDDSDCQVCLKSKGASADGTCTPLPSTTVCRAAAGPCDAVELCTGSSGVCPMDARKPNTTVCRSARGACDVSELCDGTSVSCPPDAIRPPGYVCKAAGTSATCDPMDTCDGTRTSCPANFAVYGTACGMGMTCNGLGRCL